MLIVTAIIGLVAGLSFPSAASGVEQLRLRSASDSIVGFLNTAIDRAERRQQVIELLISPQENALLARSSDLAFSRRLELPVGFRMSSIRPDAQPVAAGINMTPRRFLLYPGGTVPRLSIELASNSNRRRYVSVDPITGQPMAHAGALR